MYIICLSTQVAGVIYFFSPQFNNNSNKKKRQTHGFNPTHVGWVELCQIYVMDWVGLNFL